MTKEQKFKKEYAFELLKIAHGDLETTEVLFKSSKGRRENICFNAQQVTEKSIKAVLCYLEIAIPFTHNIDILIDRLPKKYQIDALSHVNELAEYASIRRYEDSNIELDTEDLNAAFNLANTVFQWASGIVV